MYIPTLWSSFFFFFSSRRRHTRFDCDWSSDVCFSELIRRHTRFDCDWSSDVCSSDLKVLAWKWAGNRLGQVVQRVESRPGARQAPRDALTGAVQEIGRASCRERV